MKKPSLFYFVIMKLKVRVDDFKDRVDETIQQFSTCDGQT